MPLKGPVLSGSTKKSLYLPRIESNTIKDVRNLFKIKKENEAIKDNNRRY